MMGIDDIVINFAISVGAGFVPAIIEKIRSNKNLEDHINKTFQKALDKWEVSQETEKLLQHDALKYFTDLKDYLGNNKRACHPEINDFLRLWVQEMMNDDVCMRFIILWKQEVSAFKLDDIHEILKNDIISQQNIINKNTQTTLDDTKEILEIVKSLQKQNIEELSQSLRSIMDDIIVSLIEELKVDTACKILNEIERLFGQSIRENNHLSAKMSFLKGKSLLFFDPKKAIELIHNAFVLEPEEDEYKKWEVRRLLTKKDFDNASTIASSIMNDNKCSALVHVISAEDTVAAFQRVNEKLRQDHSFRQNVLECLINNGVQDIAFLFEDSYSMIPSELTFSNLDAWLFNISLQRIKVNNYMVLSFESHQIELFKSASEATSSFYDKLSITEVQDSFPIVRCLHCYWSYICTRDEKWIIEFQKIDRKRLKDQSAFFSLLESSMLVLAKRFEEAFAVVVSACKVIDESIIQFVIMMSVHSDNFLHLRWILDKMKMSGIKVNDQIAALIAITIDKKRALETKIALEKMDFDIEGEKELLLQLCDFNEGKKIDITKFKDKVNEMSDELKAYAANLLANSGDTQLAFDMLRPIVNEDTKDIKQSIFLSVLSKMQEKTPMLYRILVKNRKAGNDCDDQLLWKEFQLDSVVADYDNALEVIRELYQRHSSDKEVFVNYLITLGHVRPQELSRYENDAKNTIYPTLQSVVLAYRAFSENGYLDTAAEILYTAAKDSDDYDIKNYYHTESMCGLIRPVVCKEYDQAKEGNYVLSEKDGKRLFYKASANGGDIGKKLLGVHKDDEVDVEIAFKPKKLTVIGIHNKYYKLACDIMCEAMDGNNPGLQPFEIDMEHPMDSLQDVIRKLSNNEKTPEERRREIREQYERGEVGLLQLVSDDNMLSGYYNLLFTPFVVHVNIAQIELQQLKELSSKSRFVLDLPTIITFAEFETKTGLIIKGPKTITKVLHEYLREVNKISIRVVDGDFYESMHSGMLFSYSEYVDVDAMKHIENLVKWTDDHCEDVIAEKALILFGSDDNTNLKKLLISSLSMLLQLDSCFVTDDKKIKGMLPNPSIISSESYVRLFNDEETSIAYSQFLFECGFRGVDIEISFIMDEYKKMNNHEDNKMVAIIQNMQENPFLISKAIACCIQLAQTELDLNTLKITFTNMFALALKGFTPKYREYVMEVGNRALSAFIYSMQFTRHCLIDAKRIVDTM